MEGGDTVARLELGHVAADLVHDARHVIALVVNVHPFGHLGGEWRASIKEKREKGVGGGGLKLQDVMRGVECSVRSACLLTFQSFGLDPLTTTLMRTWSTFGLGTGTSSIRTLGPDAWECPSAL